MSSMSRLAARLSNKTVLITGASSGIGRSTAFEFARTVCPPGPGGGGGEGPAQGTAKSSHPVLSTTAAAAATSSSVSSTSPTSPALRLVLTARRKEKLDEIAAQIRSECADSVKVHTLKLDMSAPADEISRAVDQLPAEFREIDVLINNAGLVRGVAQSPGISASDIATMVATNFTGLVAMTQAVLPMMLRRDGGNGRGDVVNIGSIAGREAYPGGSIYCATKAAVKSYTEALRKELVNKRIRIIEIDPGQVETEFSLVRFGGDKARADQVYAGVDPLTPEDIAEVIVFACGRRENVVLADALIFPNHQASATVMHRKPTS